MILPIFTSNYRFSASYLEIIRKLNTFGINPTGNEEKDRMLLKNKIVNEYNSQKKHFSNSTENNKNTEILTSKNKKKESSIWQDYHRMYFGV